ncbi:hypothetical protein LAWI1_G008339 [Lachnellula willkommii]|uniref:Protein kinase domain-containing protein n=1 Tax=Lachnellula willkommii TaxID=215461 RepID=A0A559M6K0_9HELO|nr:hypothetical protein LAWI1_G008339 [Lachnellula willkommii]
MDPFSLTVGLITVFKEVYLLSRCVYDACRSARASDEEREKLRHDLRYDLLRIRSFGRYYLKNKEIFGDKGLDSHWASMLLDIFEDLRKSLNDYKKLDDPYYKQWSPYVNENMYDTPIIEFPLDETDPIPPAIIPKKISLTLSIFNRAKETTKAAGKSAKWALFDKKTLEVTVASFRQETEKLTGLLPLAQSAQFSKIDNKIDALAATILDHDAKVLGLVPHLQLMEFNEQDEDSYSDANEVKNCTVKSASFDCELSAGTVELKREGRKVPDIESVLVELKRYPPPEDGEDVGMNSPDPDTQANVRRLAGLLKISSSGSELRTLPFKYYVHEPKEERYAFIFGYPLHAQQSEPISLHDLVKSSVPEARFPLATRFQVAQMIAQSIGVFHADGWLHKSVCSRSVVFFKERSKKSLMLESPYLVDFGYSRPEEGKTFARYQQTTNSEALYLHPDRPRMTFTKLHDIYALGVVLLEIATWKVAEDHFESATKGLDLNTTTVDKEEVREKFLSIAKRSIPYHMGVAYMEAVIACLDDTYRGHTATSEFMETFQREIIEKLSAKQLLLNQ